MDQLIEHGRKREPKKREPQTKGKKIQKNDMTELEIDHANTTFSKYGKEMKSVQWLNCSNT